MQLDGKRAIVVGGGGGLGSVIARRFALAGARVAVTDIDLAAAKSAAASLDHAIALEIDVRSRASVRDVFARAQHAIDGLDVLVYAAGVARHRDFVEVSDEDWAEVIAINLTGAFYCCQEAAFAMAARRRGSIIAIASVAAERHASRTSVYSASKAGLHGLIRAIAVDLARQGVRANLVDPGPVNTDLVRNHSATFRSAYESAIPMKRYAEPEEIAGAISYLASDEASYVTGATIVVDGGFSHAGALIEPPDA